MRLQMNRRTTTGLALIGAIIAGVAMAASSLFGEQELDQARRDITRVLSEVYQRAQSRADTGEVVRPEYASTTIELSVPELSDGWVPNCQIEIYAQPSDPRQHLQALILVPRDRIEQSGHAFVAFAFLAADPAVDSSLLESPPDWLTEPAGGYSELRTDLHHLLDRSTIEVETVVCPDFSYAVVTGRAR